VKQKTGINLTDQALVEKVIGGDTNTFKTIIKNTEGLVAQIVFKMIPNNEDRKDIAQDVYLKVFQNLGSFRSQSKLSTWIAQICYNICLNYLERKKLIFPGNFSNTNNIADDALDILSSRSHSLKNDTEDLLFQKELTEILKIEIENLSPVYKTLITLCHNEELSYAEIAQITSLPEGTVKNYLGIHSIAILAFCIAASFLGYYFFTRQSDK
jgi:RNA polymerase sigma-70 factor (ECF subfamily)